MVKALARGRLTISLRVIILIYRLYRNNELAFIFQIVSHYGVWITAGKTIDYHELEF